MLTKNCKVFPRIRPDEISMVAERDTFIATFGARYYKSHREKPSVNVTYRRELARLLIEVKKLTPSVRNFVHPLKQQNFDVLISVTKSISNHDGKNDVHKSASTALNKGTTIKQCCQTTILSVLKKRVALRGYNGRSLSKLIESEWRFEVSHRAANDSEKEH
ncbi:hypothetical protein WA026_006583 [Henosepilachna vigintioctopunctata]|uniref:Uncharacterized protein n=1 Tax=Henosepilachna vigintioctopunctata TaxID=420089 RepID=A0AAW1UG39_9CUCU